MELPKKVRKPMMEKKRRARINDSLERLKEILLHNTAAVTHGQKPTKLEKADILEMTIRYIQSLQPAPRPVRHEHKRPINHANSPLNILCLTDKNFETLQSAPSSDSRHANLISAQAQSAITDNGSAPAFINAKENIGPCQNDRNTSAIRRSAFQNVSNINHKNNSHLNEHWRPW